MNTNLWLMESNHITMAQAIWLLRIYWQMSLVRLLCSFRVQEGEQMYVVLYNMYDTSIVVDWYAGQNFHRYKDQKQEDFKAKLKTKVQTNKDKPDPKTVEPEQVDFRNMLKKGSVKTKVNQQFKTEQVDFRNQALKNQGFYSS